MTLLRRPAPSPGHLDGGRTGARPGHFPWCSEAEHRCGLGEHRSDPLPVDVPGVGRATVTRVRGVDGRHHAEVRLTVCLDQAEPRARAQLGRLLDDLVRVMWRSRRPS